MANRLKAYVRRTILDAAREGAYPAKRRTAESTRTAFIDAMRGTDTGWWNDLIYTANVFDMANRYRADIITALREYMGATGEDWGTTIGGDRTIQAGDIAAACAHRLSWTDYMEAAEGSDEDCDGEALMLGLHFAVEWYAGELAREYAPDL